MTEGPTPFFIAACSVGIKKPGHHTRLHAQMSLSIGSQSTSKRAAIPIPQTLPFASEVTQNFLGYGGFPAISTLISLQMFIHAPNPKFTPLGPSMNS